MAEIARCESELRKGNLDMEGALQGLQDWSGELRIVEEMYAAAGIAAKAKPDKLAAHSPSGEFCPEVCTGSLPLCIDLYCGLGGWTEGFLAEGYRVVGFDIEIRPYPAQLVIQDVLTIHGSQFKNAAVIVASPPCQKYSWLAMPWSRSTSEYSQAAKALRRKWVTEGPDNRLFDACFRIQREASEAAGHHIPMVVENVRGAQPWVGRAAWSYGSFYLWGDVPALMPINLKRGSKVPGFRFDGSGGSFQTASVEGMKKNPDGTNHPPGSWFRIADSSQGDRGNGNGRNDSRHVESGSSLGPDGFGNDDAGAQENGGVLAGMGAKGRAGGGWFGDGKNGATRKSDPRDVRKQADGSWMTPDGTSIVAGRFDEHGNEVGSWFRRTHTGNTLQDDFRLNPDDAQTNGTKIGGDWFSDPKSTCRKHGSRSAARKAASAQIAKIPFELARHIAATYKPRQPLVQVGRLPDAGGEDLSLSLSR